MPAHGEQCGFVTVECSHNDCDETVFRCQQAAHEAACPRRMVLCGHSGCGVSRSITADKWCYFTLHLDDDDGSIAFHQLECAHRTFVCPDGCGAAIKRLEKVSHGQQCVAKRIPCECVSLGCKKMVPRGQMAAHIGEPEHQ
jgi:hypothetical protein